jgi:NAD(P)-dependent dehydrogenase (short-subunit alcohol dehydrogenase family)
MSMKSRVRAAVRAFLNPALRPARSTPPPEPTRIVVDKLLEGRNALVTGAGRHIGLAIARELLAHGANVYCTDIDPALCASLEAELAGSKGGRRVFRSDITIAADTAALLKTLDDDKVTIDLLVNNVGVVVDDFMVSFRTNVAGPMDLTYGIAQRMVDAKRGGSIVFLTSIHGETIFTRTRAYAPSKAAVGMLIKQLAVQYAGDRIRVNGVAPGDIRVDEAGKVVPYRFTPLEETSISPQYIARAVVYLASEYFSRYTTGSIVKIDGGLSLFNYQCAADAGLYP